MHRIEEDLQALLANEQQWTEPWGASRDGSPCEKCGGSGSTRHECLSCLLLGIKPDCPACHGEPVTQAECPVCRGTGQTDGAPRCGLSVFPSIAGLYLYMLRRDVSFEGCVILELEGELAPDVDFDADEGALLVVPTTIVRCLAVQPELLLQLRATAAAGS
jgi:hypothetical protein